MDLGYWIYFGFVLVLGTILVQISHGKIFDTSKLKIKLSPAFWKVIRYFGLFIILYSCYVVILDVVVLT